MRKSLWPQVISWRHADLGTGRLGDSIQGIVRKDFNRGHVHGSPLLAYNDSELILIAGREAGSAPKVVGERKEAVWPNHVHLVAGHAPLKWGSRNAPVVT